MLNCCIIVLHIWNKSNQICCIDTESALDQLSAWKTDIKEDIDEEDWNAACLKAQSQTINTRFKWLQCKWLMRMYVTPVKLHLPIFQMSALSVWMRKELYFIVFGNVHKFKSSGRMLLGVCQRCLTLMSLWTSNCVYLEYIQRTSNRLQNKPSFWIVAFFKPGGLSLYVGNVRMPHHWGFGWRNFLEVLV